MKEHYVNSVSMNNSTTLHCIVIVNCTATHVKRRFLSGRIEVNSAGL